MPTYYPPGYVHKSSANVFGGNRRTREIIGDRESDTPQDKGPFPPDVFVDESKQISDAITKDKILERFKIFSGKYTYNEFTWFNVENGDVISINDTLPANIPIKLYISTDLIVGYYKDGEFINFAGSKYEKTAVDALNSQEGAGPSADVLYAQEMERLQRQLDIENTKAKNREADRGITNPTIFDDNTSTRTRTADSVALAGSAIGNRIQSATYSDKPDVASLTFPKFSFDKSLLNTWALPILAGLGFFLYTSISEKIPDSVVKPKKKSKSDSKDDDNDE